MKTRGQSEESLLIYTFTVFERRRERERERERKRERK